MKNRSTWLSVRLEETALERTLHQRYSLRTHGWLIGSTILLLMWGVAALQRHLGLESMALRYFVTLGVGYLAYLLVLRWWGRRLLRQRAPGAGLDGLQDLPLPDLPDVPNVPAGRGGVPLPRTGGGDFAGGGASGDVGLDGVGEAAGEGLGQLASGAIDAAASADEGAVIVVPVVAVFLIGLAVLFGAGALLLLYFGSDVLLAVAIELAFSYTAARTAARLTREGWLMAAVRLTWKPLLGAMLCAVLLGWTLDHFVPQAGSLAEALRMALRRG